MHSFENRGSYLYVEVTEPLEITAAVFQEVADACRSQDLNKVLVDLRAVRALLSTFDRYKAGIYVASIIGPKIRVAVLAQTSLINYVTETVAVNRYGKLKVSADLEEAMAWLGMGK
jgi:hypothetical protein